ncbi:MAG: serralysin [Candidatus Nitrosocaldaceae archaeon]|nr:MAG: serralysin [Candidatus Nitrosocaldaceae archaeon]
MVQISLMEEIKNIAKVVDDYIVNNIKGEPEQLYKASLHYIINGGKRLRPFLTIKSANIFNGKLDITLPIASAIEITHNFTLIHDDIMDNDEERHGVPTVHKAYDLPLAILAGDLLIVKAFHFITNNAILAGLDRDIAIEISKKLAESCVDVSEGQVLDITFAKNKDFPSIDEYIHMIKKKTGALFKVACEIGALSANASDKDVKNLADYGMNIGIAFQLVDDLIGVAGDPSKTKKPVGNDIREGKKTLPILLAMNKDKSIKEEILTVFGNKDAFNGSIKHVVELITNAGIDDEVRKEAKSYVKKALDNIKEYQGPDAHSLRVLAEFVVERTL